MSKPQQDSLDTILQATPSIRRRILKYFLLALLLAAAGFSLYQFMLRSDSGKSSYITEQISQGNLTVTVSATGQLQPTNEVEVGSEISGLIEKVFVDENDLVKQGQVLAKLDTAKLSDQVTKSTAAVAAAEAQVAQMQATVAESSANLSRLRKVAELSGGKVPSKTEIESAEASLLRAQANESNARAAVAQAIATLKSDRTNLSKASIHSPIDGIVLTRKVEPGQTVAASLQTPVLFTLAENLTQMELQVDVDEADVGQVKPGQEAFFTVDAWPGRKYPAQITRVGYGSQTKDGVVSYKTILKVNNDDLTLRPGMTATAEIVTAKKENALLVPNAALRFSPVQENTSAKNGSFIASLLPRPPSQPKQKKNNAVSHSSARQVWVLKEDKPVEIQIKTGLSDGRLTEVMEGDLQPGAQVITDTQKMQK